MRTKPPARSRHLSWDEYRRFSEARTLQRRAWPAHRVLPPLSPSQELAPVFIAPWDDRELLSYSQPSQLRTLPTPCHLRHPIIRCALRT